MLNLEVMKAFVWIMSYHVILCLSVVQVLYKQTQYWLPLLYVWPASFNLGI